MNLSRVFPAFSIGFGVIYLASMYFHPALTLFTYAPRTGQWFTGVPDLGRNGPGMYWYSWLTTGFIAGAAIGAIGLAIPETLRKKLWSGWTWVVPVALIFVLAYIERTWFGFK
jgi:hypothetical protein